MFYINLLFLALSVIKTCLFARNYLKFTPALLPFLYLRNLKFIEILIDLFTENFGL